MIESIEKLRGYMLCEPLDVCTRYFDSGEIADEIEREIAERYMLLPVDADGVPIHVGDKLTNINKPSDEYIVAGVNGEKLFIYGGRALICASQCRRVKPRTIEDVLRDLVDGIGSVEFDALTAIGEAADELRELMEVD